MNKFEVIEKLPDSAGNTKGGKWKELLTELSSHTKDKTFFLKVQLEKGIPNERSGLRQAIVKKFGSTFDVIGDQYNTKIVYVRLNPYKDGTRS